MKKLLLIDGSGFIFRAFYGLPSMTRPDGRPVNAVFGFTKMLMNLMKDSKADYIAVIFDAARKNFRNDIYPDYKGTRKETPAELIPQFPLIREAVEVLNIVSIEKEGYEADDLIASYAKTAKAEGIDVTVISSDKDMMQLVAKGIKLYDPMKQKQIGEEEIKAKFGVSSDMLLDVMSLIGDASDNVPGVSGIGPKTAAELITEYKTLENLLENTDKIKQEKRRNTLKAEADMALLSKRLISLAEDAPLPLPLTELAVKEPSCDKLRSFVKENAFRSLEAIVESWCEHRRTLIPKDIVSKSYELVCDKEALSRWVEEALASDIIAIDTETTGLNPFKTELVGISLAIGIGRACYIPLAHISPNSQKDLFGDIDSSSSDLKQIPKAEVLKQLAPLLKSKKVLKVGHNLKYDMHVLAKAYREVGLDFSITPIDDSMVMSYVLYGSSHGHSMDELAKLYLDYDTIPFSEVCGSGKNKITFAEVELEKALSYAAEDADITFRLFHFFRKELIDTHLLAVYESLDRPLIEVLFGMEEEGIPVDASVLEYLSGMFTKRMAELSELIFAEAEEDFNINSPAQLGQILFDKKGIGGGKKGANGAYSTDAEVLERLASEGVRLASLVLEYRSLAKLKSTYSDALLEQISKEDKRVHTTFSQTVTSTGRLSSNDPNLQNIPVRTEEGKAIRKAFIADKGNFLISADYSQVELRLMAEIANVKELKEAFLNDADIHASTASAVFGVPMEEMTSDLRRRAKAINFGIIYGMSSFGLAKQIGVSTKEAAAYIDAYFGKYPEIKDYMERTIEEAKLQGYVSTIFGRRCYIYGLLEKNPLRKGFSERAAINAPIQGSAADIIKKAMIELPKVFKREGLKAKMLLQVHDELIIESPKAEAEETARITTSVMEKAVELSIPLIVETGIAENWTDAH